MDKEEGRKRGGRLGSSSQPKSNKLFFLNILIWILYISQHEHNTSMQSQNFSLCLRPILTMHVYEDSYFAKKSYKMTKEPLVKRTKTRYLGWEILCYTSVSFWSESETCVISREWERGNRSINYFCHGISSKISTSMMSSSTPTLLILPAFTIFV